MTPLEHFEIGYDRDYIGTALHCLLCPPDENRVADDADTRTLLEIVAAAYAHFDTHHAAGETDDPDDIDDPGEIVTIRAWEGDTVHEILVLDKTHTLTGEQLDAYHTRIQQLRTERAEILDTDPTPPHGTRRP